MIQQHLQLFAGDGIGPAGLDAVFRAAAQVKLFVQMGQQTVHLLRRKGGGRTAAHVKGFDAQSGLSHHLRRRRNLLTQRVQIRLHQAKGLFHRCRYKAAVGAARGAEGDADVEGDIVGLQLRLGGQSGLCRFDGQTAAGRRHEIGVPENPVHSTRGLALLQKARGQLAGANPRQCTPGGRHAGDCPGRLEKAQLHGLLAQPFFFICVNGIVNYFAGNAPGGLAPIGDFGGGGGVDGALGQVYPRAVVVLAVIDGTLVGEKRQQTLLHGVAVIMTAENQLHKDIPCFI